MKKKSAMMSGANLAPVSPMLAMAMSFRTKRTIPSIAAAKPFGAFCPARCRRSDRPASHIVRKTSTAASDQEDDVLGRREVEASVVPRCTSAQRGRCTVPIG